ncbi:MAG: NUDIX domain-containing protein [Clostridia bacterium]|nr:NUDIX domain-containing protein [Clostridia bacterium]
MNKEIWDIFNEKGVPTGKTAVRGRGFLKPGEYHLVVHIWIVSPDGRFLIQRRSEKKRLMPGEWAATGGAAISGESSFQAANRELFEELSIKSDEKTLKKIFRLKRRNSLLDVWLIKAEPTPESLTLQESEVAEVKWVTKTELQHMIKTGRFHNYGREYFQKLFENTYFLEGVFI